MEKSIVHDKKVRFIELLVNDAILPEENDKTFIFKFRVKSILQDVVIVAKTEEMTYDEAKHLALKTLENELKEMNLELDDGPCLQK